VLTESEWGRRKGSLAELAGVASVLLRGAALPGVALDGALSGRAAEETDVSASALVAVGADERVARASDFVLPGSEPGLEEGRLVVGTVRTVAMTMGLRLAPSGGSEGARDGGVVVLTAAEALRDEATTGTPPAGVAVIGVGVPRGGVDVGRGAASAVTPLAGTGGLRTCVPVAGVAARDPPDADDDPEVTARPDADIALGRSTTALPSRALRGPAEPDLSTDAGVGAALPATGRASSLDDDVGVAFVGGGGCP
jgi:hypothetical protein